MCGQEHIAMCNWSLNSKDEASNAIKPGATDVSPASHSASGSHVMNVLIKKFNVDNYGKNGSQGKYDLRCDEQ